MAKIKNKLNVGITKPKKVTLVCNSMFLCMIYVLAHVKMHSDVTGSKIQYANPTTPTPNHPHPHPK